MSFVRTLIKANLNWNLVKVYGVDSIILGYSVLCYINIPRLLTCNYNWEGLQQNLDQSFENERC